MGNALFPRLAAQGMLANRRFYVPYLLALAGTVMGFYSISTMATDPGMAQMRGAEYVMAYAVIGVMITVAFAALFLFYTNSFLMKRRTRELALYNVLGMGKGHIALILLWESVYTAVIGVGGGLLLGIFFYKLLTLCLCRLLQLPVPFGFTVSLQSVRDALVLFLIILTAALLHNLRRIRTSDPIALLHSSSAGEREPKTRWLLAVVGVLTLGGGYGLALLTRNPLEALAAYFVAVILVIVGTYCLFTAGSIAVLKLLRRNRRFYYQTNHFIGVSGMLYRMKRNAVGLANICILSTMVMVMLSGTLSLYLGMEEVSRSQAPADLLLKISYDPQNQSGPEVDALERVLTEAVESQGQQVTGLSGNHYVSFSALDKGSGEYCTDYSGVDRYGAVTVFTFLTAQDYAAITGESVPQLEEDEILTWGADGQELSFTDGTGQLLFRLRTAQRLEERLAVSGSGLGNIGHQVQAVVRDMETLTALEQALRSDGQRSTLYYELRCDITGTDEEKYAVGEYVTGSEIRFAHTGEWESIIPTSRAEVYDMNFSLSGGFLFLGVFLGLLFLMATVLILYYKQISEGYEDRARYQIMQKVGLERRDIRRSVNSQMLTVFFLPLAAAGVHMLFDFRLMLQLLELFSVANTGLVALCSVGTLLVFALLYAAVFSLTARVYYRIVS